MNEVVPRRRVLEKFSDQQIQATIDELNRNGRALEMVLEGASFREITLQMKKPRVTGANDALQNLIRRANGLTAERRMEDTYSDFLEAAPYPENLLYDIFGNMDIDSINEQMPPDVDTALEYVLGRLSEKERTAVYLTYKEGETFTGAAKEMGVTPERVRQLCSRSLKKLRHPALRKYLANGYETQKMLDDLDKERRQVINQEQRKALLEKHLQPELSQYLCSHDRMLLRSFGLADQSEINLYQSDARPAPIRVVDVGFSPRVLNKLFRADIHTMDELSCWSRERLLQIKSLGRTTLMEIEKKLAEYGLSLAPDEPECV